MIIDIKSDVVIERLPVFSGAPGSSKQPIEVRSQHRAGVV
jgi:hypothetical protein